MNLQNEADAINLMFDLGWTVTHVEHIPKDHGAGNQCRLLVL
jgi:hypothetical protein